MGEVVRTRVFISYSRRDTNFCARLAQSLSQHGCDSVFDKAKIGHEDPDLLLSAQDEWWEQLKTMIAACDVMVFVVTPDSAASRVCDDEIAYARTLGKRIIAILLNEISFSAAPERLRSLNVKIDFRSDFDGPLADLLTEISTDIDWHRRGSRWMRLAHQWKADGRPDGQLLRSGAIADFDSWTLGRPNGAPQFGDDLLIFVEESRKRERADRQRLISAVVAAHRQAAALANSRGQHATALRRIAEGLVTIGKEEVHSGLTQMWPEACEAMFNNRLAFSYSGENHTRLKAAFSKSPDRLLIDDGRVRDLDMTTWALRDSSHREVRTRRTQRGRTEQVRKFLREAEPRPEKDARRRVLSRMKTGFGDHEISPDGRRVAVMQSDNAVSLWEIRSGKVSHSLAHPTDVNTCTWSPNGTVIATACDDGVVRLWSTSTGALLLSLADHGFPVDDVEFSEDGRWLLSVGGSELRIWDVWHSRLREGELVTNAAARRRTGRNMEGEAKLLSGDGKRSAVRTAETAVTIFDEGTGQLACRIENDSARFVTADFNSDGSQLVTASTDGSIAIWDTRSGEALVRFVAHPSDRDEKWLHIGALFSPDGCRVLSHADDGTARIWDAGTGAELLRFNHPMRGELRRSNMVFAADWDSSHAVTTYARDGVFRAWDVSGTSAIGLPRAAILVAAITRGRGALSTSDKVAPLLGSERADLEAALRAMLNETESSLVDTAARELSRRPNTYCYQLP